MDPHDPFGHRRVPAPVDVSGAAAHASAFRGVQPPPSQPQPPQQPTRQVVHDPNSDECDPAGHENRETIDAPPEILSKRQKVAWGTLANIDSVYSSVHALELVGGLLKDACGYFETVAEGHESKKRRRRKEREKREGEERKKMAQEAGRRRKSPGRKARGKAAGKAGSPTGKEGDQGGADLDEIMGAATKESEREGRTAAAIDAFLRGRLANTDAAADDRGGGRPRAPRTAGSGNGGDASGGGDRPEADAEEAITDWKNILRHGTDAIRLAMSGLERHASIISRAAANSTDNKEVKQAQRKLMRKDAGNNARIREKMMERNPEAALGASMKYVEEALGAMLARTNPDFLAGAGGATKAKKRKKVSVEDVVAGAAAAGGVAAGEGSEDGEGAAKRRKKDAGRDNDERSEAVDVIDLPEPMEGKIMYSPLETVSYVQNMIDNDPGREYLRAYKEKIMREKLVPIQKSQLNSMVRTYGGPDGPVAPLTWANRGAEETGWKSLLHKFHEKQSRGMPWSIDDTREALGAAAAGRDRAAPGAPLIETHHRTLIQLRKLQDHIGRQVEAQEERLKRNPPRVLHKPRRGTSAPAKKIRFDRDDERYDGVVLPEPKGGELMYTPRETVDNFAKFVEGDPRPGRTAVRVFKEKMIAERVVPVSISQLNCLLRKCSGPDGQPPPRHWNLRGQEEIMSIDDLAGWVRASRETWTFEDTRAAVWAAKREKRPSRGGTDAKCPDKKTINVYHTALMSIPELAGRVAKPVVQKPGPKSNQMG